MRHRKRNIKLGRTASHRDAMLRNMAQSLLEYGRITTTVSKGKAVKPLIDRLVNLAKRGKDNLHAIRQAAAILYKPEAVTKLFDDPVGRFGDRVSGFTQMVRAGLRKGDAAPMCVLQLVTPDLEFRSRKAREAIPSDRRARVAASQSRQAAAPQAVAAPLSLDKAEEPVQSAPESVDAQIAAPQTAAVQTEVISEPQSQAAPGETLGEESSGQDASSQDASSQDASGASGQEAGSEAEGQKEPDEG